MANPVQINLSPDTIQAMKIGLEGYIKIADYVAMNPFTPEIEEALEIVKELDNEANK